MKQHYLVSNRGRVHLFASLVLAAAVGLAVGGASHPTVGDTGASACAAVLGSLGYAIFILEMRTNSLVRVADAEFRPAPPQQGGPEAVAGVVARQVAAPLADVEHN